MPPLTAQVFVTLKRSVLDPQGATIASALKKMQYKAIEDVRQGKYFELTFVEAPNQDASAIELEVERIAREVLTNPVIEEFTYTLGPPGHKAAK
ncbi:MAG: phosphoribosylformylglycinamidine synthase subunit PurS [Acidobacteriaceae bacterium]